MGTGRICLAAALVRSTLRSTGKTKVFCVGRNKTGTTSLAKALRDMGIEVGIQHLGERLIHDWQRRDFRRLFRLCHTAQAFQDIPFSWPDTFRALDARFPGSKFILTLRDDPEQWHSSSMNYLAKVFGNGTTVTVADLRRSRYIYPGWSYASVKILYGLERDDDFFRKDIMIASYLAHERAVRAHFLHRPNDLLILNVAGEHAFPQLLDFLKKPRMHGNFPHENRTADL